MNSKINRLSLKSQGMTAYAQTRKLLSLSEFIAAKKFKLSKDQTNFYVNIEVSSVNSRFLDFSFRSNEQLKILEPTTRSIFKKIFERGRISFAINFEPNSSSEFNTYAETGNKHLVSMLNAVNIKNFQSAIIKQFPNAKQLSVFEIIKLLETISNNSLSNQSINQVNFKYWHLPEVKNKAIKIFSPLIIEVAEKLLSARINEASGIIILMKEKCKQIQKIIPKLTKYNNNEKKQALTKIKKQVNSLAINLDPQRLAQESAIIATKIDVTEEIERLEIHHNSLIKLINSNKTTMGKPLEFLLQEINREANTIAAKTSTNRITNLILELKMTLEKIREQAQNLQ